MNLVKNALKFTHHGRIDIKFSYNEIDKLFVGEVRDTGTGIEKEELPKLFDKFGRLHRTAKMNHDGIGLGLQIVKEIILKSGGIVAARSKGPGFGSSFTFSMSMEKALEANPRTAKLFQLPRKIITKKPITKMEQSYAEENSKDGNRDKMIESGEASY